MSMLKQVVLIRTDLGLPRGLLMAQACHVHMDALRMAVLNREANGPAITKDMLDWLAMPYLFIHGVSCKEAFDHYLNLAQVVHNLPVATWHDTISLSFYEGQKMVLSNVPVGFSIGPCDSDKIKAVIGDLPLLP